MRSLDLVKEFHETFDQPVLDEPRLDDEGVNQLRLALLLEELVELGDALGYRLVYDGSQGKIAFADSGCPTVSVVGALDALTDLQYVLDGTYLSLGFGKYKDEALKEVHSSNMSKKWPDGSVRKHPNGKVWKPDTYREADLDRVLSEPQVGDIVRLRSDLEDWPDEVGVVKRIDGLGRRLVEIGPGVGWYEVTEIHKV